MTRQYTAVHALLLLARVYALLTFVCVWCDSPPPRAQSPPLPLSGHELQSSARDNSADSDGSVPRAPAGVSRSVSRVRDVIHSARCVSAVMRSGWRSESAACVVATTAVLLWMIHFDMCAVSESALHC
jgi:hypothetical protein